MGYNYDLEQLRMFRDWYAYQYWVLLSTQDFKNPQFSRIRLAFEYYSKEVLAAENARKERNTKMIITGITIGGGMASIPLTCCISNSSLGAKFDNAMKGLTGKITGGFFR